MRPRSGTRLTVIDHNNDMHLDTGLAVSGQEAGVGRVSPLQVRVGQDVLDAEKYCMTDVFSEGEAVWYMELAGQGFVQPMHAT